MTASAPRPAPLKDEVAAGFAAVADQFNATGSEFFTQMGARLAAAAGIRPGAAVLDCGCGTGAVTVPAARAAGPGGRVTGIDLARPMLQQARAATRRYGAGWVSFQHGDAENPPYPGESFDVVLAGYVIQLLPGPDLALANWRRLLRPGGTLAVSWGLAQDPAWQPVMAAVDAHLPDGVAGFDEFFRRPPFTGTGPFGRLLAGLGYEHVTTTVHVAETVYRDPGEWWAACRTQAPWLVSWKHIPPAELGQAERDARTILQPMRGPAGELRRQLSMAITTATRPGAGEPALPRRSVPRAGDSGIPPAG